MTQYRVQGEDQPEPPSASSKALRWIVGWVLMPLLFFGTLFVFGMHWGAHHPDSQWVSITRWIAVKLFDEDPELFSDPLRADPSAPDSQP